MKRLLNILFILCLYLILCSKSCSDDTGQVLKQAEEVSAAKDSIRSEFEAGYLSEEARFALEIKAVQELKDIADYIKIYSDNSVDSLFREKAGEMIRNIFISDDVRLPFGMVKNKKVKPLTLGKFLEKGLEDVTSADVVFDSVTVWHPLQKTGTESYTGTLRCSQKVMLFAGKDTIAFLPGIINVEMLATRTVKIFGTDTMKVWSVSLGNMDKAE
jgi:hypothetical protein